MRRAHSEITDQQQIIGILKRARVGRMATHGSDGFPYITPVNYVFHNDKIYFHSAHKGEKMDNLLRDDKVCFEVDNPLAYLEVAFNGQNKACAVHELYECVIIRGRAKVIDDPEAKIDALNALVAAHEDNRDFDPIPIDDPMVKACAAIEITPESITCKADLIQNKPEEDRRKTAADLAGRGLPGDLEAVRAMGFELEGDPHKGWRLKD